MKHMLILPVLFLLDSFMEKMRAAKDDDLKSAYNPQIRSYILPNLV